RDDRSALWFGLFTMLLSFRTLFIGERFIPGLFPDRFYEFLFAADFITITIPVSLFLLYVYEIFPGIVGKRLRIVSILPGFIFTACIIIAPARIFVHLLPVMNITTVLSCVAGLSVAIIALFRKHTDALIFILGFLIFSATVANDILYSMYYVNTGHIASFGLCVFLLCQGLIISLRYAKIYRSNVELAGRLEAANRLLESAVSERTVELRKTNEELAEKNVFLNKLTDRLERMAYFDELTHIANKRYFNFCFETEWKRAARRTEVFSLIMIDIDFFKKYNDTYGHLAGDECLALVAKTLNESLNRPGDFVARFGGEEFSVLLPGTDLAGAVGVAEKMRKKVSDHSILHEHSPEGRITISCGIASGTCNDFTSSDDMLVKADEALYSAKDKGRNRVERYIPVSSN
ncbi:MAG TPA: diguanylate cyclase, partial [Spirochaetota bacterium]